MAPFLFAVRGIAVSTWIVLGLLTELILFPLLGRAGRQRVVRLWSHGLMWLSGIRVRVLGQPVLQGAVLWAANHISWVDVFVLNRVRTASFVAKSDIRRWPVLGLLVTWAGTLFIDRTQRRAVREAGRQMQDCFACGDVVGLFPEGTSSTGLDVLPFHSGLFEAALQAAAPVQPVALRFLRGTSRAPELAFVGEQTLVGNLWILLGARGVIVECEFLPVVEPAGDLTRADLARQVRAAIRQVVVA